MDYRRKGFERLPVFKKNLLFLEEAAAAAGLADVLDDREGGPEESYQGDDRDGEEYRHVPRIRITK